MKEFWKWCLAGGVAGAVFAVFEHVNSPLPTIPGGLQFYGVFGQIIGSTVAGAFTGSLAFLVHRWLRKKPYE